MGSTHYNKKCVKLECDISTSNSCDVEPHTLVRANGRWKHTSGWHASSIDSVQFVDLTLQWIRLSHNTIFH